jgi:hypothetical protein
VLRLHRNYACNYGTRNYAFCDTQTLIWTLSDFGPGRKRRSLPKINRILERPAHVFFKKGRA